MNELDKALKMMASIKEHIKEEDRNLEELAKLRKKMHLLAELEELEIEDMAWEERIQQMIREDVELDAENAHKELKEEEKYWKEKLKYPSWTTETANEASITLNDFDNTSFDQEHFLKSVQEMKDVQKIEEENGKYQITLHTGKILNFNPETKNISLNDFSDNTLHVVANLAKLCCSNLDFSDVVAQKKALKLNENHFENFQNIATANGLELSLSKDNEMSMRNEFSKKP